MPSGLLICLKLFFVREVEILRMLELEKLLHIAYLRCVLFMRYKSYQVTVKITGH